MSDEQRTLWGSRADEPPRASECWWRSWSQRAISGEHAATSRLSRRACGSAPTTHDRRGLRIGALRVQPVLQPQRVVDGAAGVGERACVTLQVCKFVTL